MSSKTVYNRIRQAHLPGIKAGEITIDPFLQKGITDSRRGLSLIIPVNLNRESYQSLVHKMKEREPDQYFYPYEDLHITVFDFVKGSSHYLRDETREALFLSIAREAVSQVRGIGIKFSGIVFSREAGIIKGYDNNQIIRIRENIRHLLERNKLKNDERYQSETAHVTFIRFKTALACKSSLLDFSETYGEYDLGTAEIKKLEFVEHDWYNRQALKRVISPVALGKNC